jgi:general secretion pathway protein F
VNFKYQSIDPNGRKLDGDIEADSRKQALSKLKQQSLRVTGLTESGTAAKAKKGKGKVNREELLLALSELATLLRAGVSLKDAIDSLSGGERGQCRWALCRHYD